MRADRMELHSTDATAHALHAGIDAAAAAGSAVHAISASAAAGIPAVLIESAGDLLNCKTVAGISRLKVDASGAALGGDLRGSKAWLYQYLEPAGTVWASQDGRSSASAVGAALATGTVYCFAAPIEAGAVTTSITLVSLTAEGTGTHAWVGVADNTNKVLAVSADNTGAAYFAANTAVTTAMTAPFTHTYTGLHYVFVCVVASVTMPTFAAAPALAHAALSTVPPILCGTALTGQTTPPAVNSSLGTITPTAGHNLYAYGT